MSEVGKDARVRFAPSPTGYLHVGGARTAIFNWLFARRAGATFVIRIEDTDIERSTKESETSLLDDLGWLGLDWDEGPDKDGPFGPYRQSERLDLYKKKSQEFVEADLAYPCFCTDELLEAKRKKARAEGKPPHYDGTCRSLSAEEMAIRRGEGLPEVVRFKVAADETIHLKDLIRGNVDFTTGTVGDFVILRSNGHPTYNFAAALDDHLMKITHVLRGEEHLPNTMRQVMIYRALDADIPEFAHLPLILAEDRSKLSKRHGASSVDELRSLGFLSEAVVNYLVLLGWSHPEGKEVLEQSQLVASFSLDRVNKSAAVYDKQKLTWMNGQHIRSHTPEALFERALSYLPEHIRTSYDDAAQQGIFRLLHDSIDTLADLGQMAEGLRATPVIDDEAEELLKTADAQNVLQALAQALEESKVELTSDEFKTIMKSVGKATGAKGKGLFFPVRAALTGSVHGPDLAAVAVVRGRAMVIELLEKARRSAV